MAWHCKAKGGYLETSAEGKENADKIRWILNHIGWTDNAVCGLLGNIAHESGINPWRWQDDSVKSVEGAKTTKIGYGLVQWTPAKNYVVKGESSLKDLGFAPNYSNQQGGTLDGQAQCYWIDRVEGQWTPDTVDGMTFSEYKASTMEAGELAVKFLLGFERPKYPNETKQLRIDSARYFWEYFLGQPSPPPEPEPEPEPPEPEPDPPYPPDPSDPVEYKSDFNWLYYLKRPKQWSSYYKKRR